jgi:transposase
MLRIDDKPIYLCCGATDMRKSINGLSAIVECGFKLDPFSNSLFVFCNRNRDRIKILEWDGDGFWLYFKRLEKGHFKWSAASDDGTITLNREDFYHLLGIPGVIQKLLRREVKPSSAVQKKYTKIRRKGLTFRRFCVIIRV